MRSTHLLSLVSLAAVLTASFVPACGGSSPAAPPAATNDAGAPAPAAQDDAGSAPDPHTIYPAAHPPLPDITNHGGRVLTAPKLVTVTFSGLDATIRDYLRDFDDKILGTPWWSTAMDGYGVGAGAGAGYAELDDVFSNQTVSDYDVQVYIAHQILAGKLPVPDDQTVYMMYMPSAATVQLEGQSSCQSFGGYHGSAKFTSADLAGDAGADASVPDDAGVLTKGDLRFVYAVLMECYSTFPGVTPQDIKDEETSTASHEIAEAATDPDVNVADRKPGWFMTNNDAWAPDQRGGEVGDLCENRAGVQQDQWQVTKVWNFASAKKSLSPCVPDTPVFYGAVPHTEIPARTEGGAPSSDGYVVVHKGETRDVEVDVFSTAPLSGPLTIVAGRPKFNSTDPTQVNPLKGVTLTVSQPTAQNGDQLKMTVAVDPTAASGSQRFYVRAVLSPTDYRSWPAIVYIP